MGMAEGRLAMRIRLCTKLHQYEVPVVVLALRIHHPPLEPARADETDPEKAAEYTQSSPARDLLDRDACL